MTSLGTEIWMKFEVAWEAGEEIMLQFVVITMTVDGLAPLGARPSTGIVMTTFVWVYIQDQRMKVQD